MAYETGGTGVVEPPAAGPSGRTGLIVLGSVAGVAAVVAGGVWAATTFFFSGPQPAEALPASTVAYASVDLNPNGAQKVEAIKMLRKFPAIQDELKLDPDDDLVQKFFDESNACQGVDYEEDVKPWLGARAAFALVEADDEPQPVGVLQVKDGDQAEKGITTLRDKCSGSEESGDGAGGYVVSGDWIVFAETEEIAETVVDEAEKSPLADDDAFNKWTDEAGDDGIMTVYVSKKVTDYAGEALRGASSDSLLSDESDFDSDFDSDFESDFDSDLESDEDLTVDSGSDWMEDDEIDEDVKAALEEFEGAAMKLRFNDGGLELETAVGAGDSWTSLVSDSVAADLIGTLPEDSVAAFGFGLEEGWAQQVLDKLAEVSGEDTSVEDLISEAETETGLTLPEDLETLLGEGVAIALGPDIDPDAISNGGPEELPVAVKVKGDPDAIESVLDKIRPQLDSDEVSLLETSEGDGVIAFGPNEGFRDEAAKDGSLKDNEVYEEIVESDDATALLFVNFNAADDWLVRLAEDSTEAADNLRPLRAFGISTWVDDNVGHSLIKLTTD